MKELILYHLCMQLDLVLVLLTVILFVNGIRNENKIAVIIGAINSAYLICQSVLFLFDIQLHLAYRIYIVAFLTVLTFFVFYFTCYNKRLKKISTVFFMIFTVYCCFCSFWGQIKTVSSVENDIQFTGFYGTVTGIGENKVFYYRKYNNFFVSTKCSYMENYGINLGTIEQALNKAPYYVKFYDEDLLDSTD